MAKMDAFASHHQVVPPTLRAKVWGPQRGWSNICSKPLGHAT